MILNILLFSFLFNWFHKMVSSQIVTPGRPTSLSDATGQGQECSSPRPRTKALVFSKKMSLKKIFRQYPPKKTSKKVFKQIFHSGDLQKRKKRSSQIFREISGVFQQNSNGSKNSAVLERSTFISILRAVWPIGYQRGSLGKSHDDVITTSQLNYYWHGIVCHWYKQFAALNSQN